MGNDSRYSTLIPGHFCTERFNELAADRNSDDCIEPFDIPESSGIFGTGWELSSVSCEPPCPGVPPPSPAGQTQAQTQKQDEPQFLYSPAFRATSSATFGLGTNLTWDAYQRGLYMTINNATQKQVDDLLKSGIATEADARALVEQRNKLVIDARKPLSPFGKVYSELEKPAKDLPTYEQLLQKKGSFQAVLKSVGKTRVITNDLTARFKIVGKGAIVLEIVLTAVLIVEAKPEDRARVADGQAGGIAGGAIGGWAGAWAGCLGASALASPTLVIPLWGEVSEGGACLVGGIVGGLGGGAFGAWSGEKAGEATYDYVTTLKWTNQ